MSMAYRGLEHVAASRFEELAERRALQIDGLAVARKVYARRVARVAAGAVATLGAIVVFLVAAREMISSPGFLHTSHLDGTLTRALLACWPAAIAAYLVARVVATRRIGAILLRPLARMGDAVHDLARLETSDPSRVLERRAVRLEGLSVALPLAALAFLMPLTIHFFVGQLIGIGGTRPMSAKSYDEWIGISVAIVGHAHLVLAICAFRFGLKLAARGSSEIEGSLHEDWLKAFGFTVLAGAIPGALFFLVPPILVSVTGLTFVPFMFLFMGRRLVAERALVGTVCEA